MMHKPCAGSARLLVARLIAVAVVVALSTTFFASPAAADQPTKSEGTMVMHSDLTDVCPFTVGVESSIQYSELKFFDRSGSLIRLYQHTVEQDVFTANNKTLTSVPYTFNIEFLFDSSGNLVHMWFDGAGAKIPLPDGTQFVSAGRFDMLKHPEGFVLSPDKGNPGNVAALCAALS